MMSRFFPPAAATARLLCLAALAAAAMPLRGQTVAAPGSGRTPRPKNGHLRLLNMLPLNGDTFELAASAAPPDGRPLQTASPSNFSTPYTTLPPVNATFRICRAANRQASVKVIDVPLRADGYFTILAHLVPGGQPAFDLIDDFPEVKIPPVNRLTVRQFCPDLRVIVSTPSRVQTDPLPYGGSQTLNNLPDGVLPLTMNVIKVSGGVPVSATSEASFQRARRVTVFLVNDPYNRIHPHLTIDGPSRTEEDAIDAEAQPGPTP